MRTCPVAPCSPGLPGLPGRPDTPAITYNDIRYDTIRYEKKFNVD